MLTPLRVNGTQDSLLICVEDEYYEEEGACSWRPEDITAYEAEASKNEVVGEADMDAWLTGQGMGSPVKTKGARAFIPTRDSGDSEEEEKGEA